MGRVNPPSDIDDAVRRLKRVTAASFGHLALEALRVPESVLIRAGRAGGLPFDSLSTDVVSGCLPGAHVCFGSCFAASASFASGEQFGKRVDNRFAPDVFSSDLERIPDTQGYVRNGWNSDPSWNWEMATLISMHVRRSNRLPVLLTKCFVPPPKGILEQLAGCLTELRVTISAFDLPRVVQTRLSICENYRAVGGIAIPVVVTTVFKSDVLNRFQDEIVSDLVRRDLPAAENSLRFEPSEPCCIGT